MNSIKLKTAAKINLALDVTGRLENGYHTIESVFQTVGLYDEITVETDCNDGIALSCTVPDKFAVSDEIPCDERNIAFKAARLFFAETGLGEKCSIHITKGIPSQAGMGGGSTDAAAVLFALNIICGTELSRDKLSHIGKKLGADVPFFFTGGTAFVSGIGEKITPIADYSGKILVIAKGRDGVSTVEAYRNIDSLENPLHPDTNSLVRAIESSDSNAYRFFGNLFEQAVRLEEVDSIKQIMNASGALSAVMTGSGSAVFGLFSDMQTASDCAEKLSQKGFFAEVCETVSESFIY